MAFSSLLFLFGFLPLCLFAYYVAPRRLRNTVLLVAGLLFYAWGEPIYVLLMVFSFTAAYVSGLMIAKAREHRPRFAFYVTIFSVVLQLSVLFFFKYYNFFAENLSRLPFLSLPTRTGLVLPLGISFYTFELVSYTVDLWRGYRPERNYFRFGTYVTLFPQLVAGPIVRYREINGQLTQRRESCSEFAAGVSRFCVGLAKKLVLGDALAAGSAYCRTLMESEPSLLCAWLTVIYYTLHLYFDFSGYTDMAIGLGHLFGFHLPENFDYPYISRSITEFWRRWHISLSSWFREYVYIPLGGNRHGRLKQCRNLAVVWLLTGLWHGANWNFLLWGAYFAVLLILEKLFLLRFLERMPKPLRHIYTMVVVIFGFLIFSYSDLSSAFLCARAMLGIGVPMGGEVVWYQLLHTLPLLMIAVIGATPLPRRLWSRLPLCRALTAPVCAALLLLCMAYLTDSTFTPFAYAQF